MMSCGGWARNGDTAVVVQALSSRQARIKGTELYLIVMADLPCGFLSLIAGLSHCVAQAADLDGVLCLDARDIDLVENEAESESGSCRGHKFPVC